MNEERTYFAVYGILRGDINRFSYYSGTTYQHDPIMAEFARPVGPCVIPGRLYSVGGSFPALLPRSGRVKGQLWEVVEGWEELAFTTLDGIESYDPKDERLSMYLRRRVDLIRPEGYRPWVYVWNGPAPGMRVRGNDWKVYQDNLNRTRMEQLMLPNR